MNRFDTEKSLVYHSPVRFSLSLWIVDKAKIPRLGNGYLGLSHSAQSQIQLLPDIRSSFIASGYSPVIRISSDTWEDSSASVVQMKQGVLRRLQCFKFSESRSASVNHLLYAHRKRSSLIVQEIDFVNPSENTLDLNLEQKQLSFRPDLKTLDERDVQFESSDEKFAMTIHQISPRQHHLILVVTISTKILPNIHIKPGG